jgi:hypothetical protein
MIIGLVSGFLVVMAICMGILFMLRRPDYSHENKDDPYETETEATEETIITDFSFETSIDHEYVSEEAGFEGTFAESDAFSGNPEETALFY